MKTHSFLFSPGLWLGEGKIRLSMIEEELVFFTRWKVSAEEDQEIVCIQEIQVKGVPEVMVNHFSITNIAPYTFSVFMENHAIGKVAAKGIVKNKIIGWEFRVEEIGFEGFEWYELQEDDSYTMQAEFATVDQLRTNIRGKIWKQVVSS